LYGGNLPSLKKKKDQSDFVAGGQLDSGSSSQRKTLSVAPEKGDSEVIHRVKRGAPPRKKGGYYYNIGGETPLS